MLNDKLSNLFFEEGPDYQIDDIHELERKKEMHASGLTGSLTLRNLSLIAGLGSFLMDYKVYTGVAMVTFWGMHILAKNEERLYKNYQFTIDTLKEQVKKDYYLENKAMFEHFSCETAFTLLKSGAMDKDFFARTIAVYAKQKSTEVPSKMGFYNECDEEPFIRRKHLKYYTIEELQLLKLSYATYLAEETEVLFMYGEGIEDYAEKTSAESFVSTYEKINQKGKKQKSL